MKLKALKWERLLEDWEFQGYKMTKYPKPLTLLINELAKLPGVGQKSAQRLAFHILDMYEDAKLKANAEATLMIEEAKKTINFEKMKAMTDVKNEIANLSIDMAEKVLRHELADKNKQEELIEGWMKELNLN